MDTTPPMAAAPTGAPNTVNMPTTPQQATIFQGNVSNSPFVNNSSGANINYGTQDRPKTQTTAASANQ